MKIHSEDTIILRHLLSVNAGEYVAIYDLHSIYRLSPAQLSRSIRKLSENQIIEVHEDSLRLRSTAVEWLIKNRRLFYSTIKSWKEIPEEFKGSQINSNEIYLPPNLNDLTFET
jgi:hypothetical protein